MSVGFINNTKHFAITNSSLIVQDALNDGRLENPYVALVDGELDYNSMEPQEDEPCYLGEWNGSEFTILDTGSSEWENAVTIGQLQGVYVHGALRDLDIILTYSDGYWNMELFHPDESEQPTYDFEEGVPDTWDTGVNTEFSLSASSISVYYDGDVTFNFMLDDGFLLTENPECPGEGPVE